MIRTDTPARRAYGTVTTADTPDGNARMAWHRNGDPAGTIYYRAGDETRDPYAEALALIGLRRPHELNAAMSTIREGWDDTDDWGSAIHALGAVLDVLAAFHDRPALVAMRDSEHGFESWETQQLAGDVLDGVLEEHDLRLAVRILGRYAELLPESERY